MSLEMIQRLLEIKQQQKSNAGVKSALEEVEQLIRENLHVDTNPATGASHAISFIRSHGGEGVEPWQHIDAINAQIERIRQGDLSQVEEMLLAQSLTLQTTFNTFTSLGSVLAGQSSKIDQAIALMQLGLKAQEQSRKTLQTLMELKNPKRATFIKNQVNQVAIRQDSAIAHPQDAHPSSEPRPIQELEASPYAEMDTRSKAETARTDSQLAAVEIKHGPHNRGRKAKSVAKLD